ncbi:MAG: aldo/keto reductase [Phycisphaerales bacterium]|jgi:aryl-alcohol dehydrogenase-like predicted oxidoreductase
MNKHKLSRRDFIHNTSRMSALTVAAALTDRAQGSTHRGDKKKIDTSKILNYNPNMGYRRLGKTGLMISEVSLGGHWRAPWRDRSGGWWWGKFAKEQVPDDVARNRTEVVSRAMDCGMNYLDITGAEECLCYGAALKGRREKMFVGADDSKLCPRHDEYCNVKAQLHNVEECLRHIKTDYLDIWRVQAKMDGTNTDADVEVMIETFGKLHKAGKARHFGISSHSRPWAQHVIEKYPEVEMFIFPCTAKTKQKDTAPTRGNIEEVNAGYGPENKSVFQSLRDHDVGLITIKPFFGGRLLETHDKPKLGVGNKKDNDLARLTLQCILNLNDAVTAVIPGLSTIYEVDNAARASYTRSLAMTPADKDWLVGTTDQRWADLPQEYTWLRDWEVV